MVKAFTEEHPGMTVGIRAAATAGTVVEMVRTDVTEVGLLPNSEPPTSAGVVLEAL